MAHKIIQIEPKDNLILTAVFQDGREKTYDIKQLYRMFPQMKKLSTDARLYKSVQIDAGGYGISWNDALDLDAEEIWENGLDTGVIHDTDVRFQLASKLVEARESHGMTQKELSKAVNITQGDISKIENGSANPSIATLKRIAEGLDMKLEISFTSK